MLPTSPITENHFRILDTLDRQEISTQRQLAESTGISLGQINYVLKLLLEKGLVKIGNFQKNPRKISYVYLLTPKGIEAKSRLAVRFVMAKLKEYKEIRQKLADRLTAIEKGGHQRIIFLGPEIVKDLVHSIIKENALTLLLVGHCKDWQEFNRCNPLSFDIVLDFGGDRDNKTRKLMGIARDRVVRLW